MSKWGGRKVAQLLQLVIATYGRTCWLCLLPVAPGSESIDHRVPRSRGGTDDLRNLALAHRRCNYSRGNKMTENPHVKFRSNVEFFE